MKRRNCPYLGLQYDSSTCHSFPSDHNFCHKVSVPGPVDIEFQTAVCLTEDYLDCPIYNGVEVVLPSAPSTPIKRGILRCGCIFGGIAFLSILVALAAPSFTGSSGVRNVLQLLGAPTQEIFYTPTSSTNVAEQFAATHTPTLPVTRCTTPEGWTAYLLQAGDDLVAIANQRGVDLAAVSRGNCDIDLMTLVAGDLIFLPLSGMPSATETLAPTVTLAPSATNTLEPLPTETFTPTPTDTETSTPTITATRFYPPTATQPPPPPTRRPRNPNPPPPPTQPPDRPTATPPPVR